MQFHKSYKLSIFKNAISSFFSVADSFKELLPRMLDSPLKKISIRFFRFVKLRMIF